MHFFRNCFFITLIFFFVLSCNNTNVKCRDYNHSLKVYLEDSEYNYKKQLEGLKKQYPDSGITDFLYSFIYNPFTEEASMKWKYMTEAFKTEQRESEVYNWLRNIYKLYPNDPQVLTIIHEGFFYNEYYKESLQYILKAYQVQPDSEIIINDLALTYLRLNNYKKSEEFYKKVLKVFPNSWRAYNGLGVITIKRDGNKEKAIKYLKKSYILNPQNAEVISDIGAVYYKLGDFKKAVEYFSKAIEMNPNRALFYLNMGSTYGNMQNYEEAITYFKRAVKINPRYSVALFHLGKTYMYQGD